MHIRALNIIHGTQNYNSINSLINKLNSLLTPTHVAKQKYVHIIHATPLKDVLEKFFKATVKDSEAKPAKNKFTAELKQIENEFNTFQGLLLVDANQLPNMANVTEAAILELNRILENKPLNQTEINLLLEKQKELFEIRSQLSAAMKKLLELENDLQFQGKGLLYYFLKRLDDAARTAGFSYNLNKKENPLPFNSEVSEEKNNNSLIAVKNLIVEDVNTISEALSNLDESNQQQTTYQFLTSLVSQGARAIGWNIKSNRKKDSSLDPKLKDFYIDYIRQFGSISEKYFIVTHYYDYQMIANYAWGMAVNAADLATEIGANILAAPVIAKNYFASGWTVYSPWDDKTVVQSQGPVKEEKVNLKEEEQAENSITINNFEDFYSQLKQFKDRFNTTHDFISDFNLGIIEGLAKVYTHVDDYLTDEERKILIRATEIENRDKSIKPTVTELKLVTQAISIRVARATYRQAIQQLNDENPQSNIFIKLRNNCKENENLIKELNQIETAWKGSRQHAELTANTLNDLAETLNKFEEYIQLIKQEFLSTNLGRKNSTYSEQFSEKYENLYEQLKGISAEQKEQFSRMIKATEDLIYHERCKLVEAMLARLSLSTADDLTSGKTLTDDIALATINKLEKFGLSRKIFIDPFIKKSPEHKTLTPALIEEFKVFITKYGTPNQKNILRTIIGGDITLRGHDVLNNSLIGSLIVLPEEEKTREPVGSFF